MNSDSVSSSSATRRLFRLWVLVLGLFFLACAPRAATPLPLPTPTTSPIPIPRLYPLPRLNSPEYGMQAFIWWHADSQTGERDAALVKDMGFGWLKQEFVWGDISHVRGAYYWGQTEQVVELAERLGLKLLVRLGQPPAWAETDPARPVNLADLGEFCAQVAAQYKGRIAAYEVWNEPNLAREWADRPPDPAGYVELLKACYLAIKRADPQAIVISAGLAPTDRDDEVAMPDRKFFQAMYDAGALPYFDMLGVHAPGYSSPPERSPEEIAADPNWASSVWVFRHVEDIRALMVANGDADKQIAVTEMGWTSDPFNPDYAWYAVAEAQKADYLVRAYQYAKANWSPWIGLMSAIYIADPEWTEQDEQYWWAITRPTKPGDPPDLLPAYIALKNMAK